MVGKAMSTGVKPNGFSIGMGAEEARRQLRMSLSVVVMLTVAIVSAAATFGSHPLSAQRDVVVTTPVTTPLAETNVVGAKPI